MASVYSADGLFNSPLCGHAVGSGRENLAGSANAGLVSWRAVAGVRGPGTEAPGGSSRGGSRPGSAGDVRAPIPTRFDVEGRPDQEELQRAKVRVGRILGPRLRTTDEQIADLQADASHFWEPTESEWSQAADLLGVRVNDLRNARYRPPPS